MRVPLITPLASRNGTVEKDERLVNCYGEQDVVTKETRVIKRAGIDEGDAVISGPDIYGQGIFSYGGYIFAMIGDILGYWVYVGGMQPGGGGGAVTYFNESFTQDFNPLSTYNINDSVIYNGQRLYSHAENNDAPPDSEFGQYMWDLNPGQVTYEYACLAGGYWASSPAAACNSYLWEVTKVTSGTDYGYTGASYPGSCQWTQATPPGNPPSSHSAGIVRA